MFLVTQIFTHVFWKWSGPAPFVRTRIALLVTAMLMAAITAQSALVSGDILRGFIAASSVTAGGALCVFIGCLPLLKRAAQLAFAALVALGLSVFVGGVALTLGELVPPGGGILLAAFGVFILAFSVNLDRVERTPRTRIA